MNGIHEVVGSIPSGSTKFFNDLAVSDSQEPSDPWANRECAEQGYAKAQRNLGMVYANGAGVPQDLILAHMWFSLAAAAGLESARENLDPVARAMTPDQITEAQRIFREWLAKHQQ